MRAEHLLDLGFWFSVFFATAWLLFCMVYSLILFADLRIDHINPIELCERINQLRLPESVPSITLPPLLSNVFSSEALSTHLIPRTAMTLMN